MLVHPVFQSSTDIRHQRTGFKPSHLFEVDMAAPMIRFYRGELLLGAVEAIPGLPLLEIAEIAGIHIMRNCTSGNCGTCMCTLKAGSAPMPDPLPPGIDEYLIEDGAILTCIGIPEGPCDIDLIPPPL
jgi:ferredoxin